MSSRRILVVCVCLVFSGAICVKEAIAQGPKVSQKEKLVRVTYPVADLVVPIHDHTAFPERQPKKDTPELSKDALAEAIIQRILDTIAKASWKTHGGAGTIQYFPLGMAIVVDQTPDVQKQVARRLADLRREQDVQVSIELRLIMVSPKLATRILKDLKQQGQPVQAFQDEQGKLAKDADGIGCLNEKLVFDLLATVQGDRMAHIMQSPKITVFDGQRAGLDSTMRTGPAASPTGLRCDLWPIVDAERKTVRLHLDLELAQRGAESAGVLHRALVNAVGTFAVPSGQTIVWPLGQTAERQHLFALVTPRVLIVKDEAPVRLFLGNIRPIPGR